ncbi:MAG: ATP-binding protein [Halobacteriota archaeon]|jgi:signal transduction histidine kinase
MYARDRALRVLLVEDNPGDAHLIKRLLTKSSATKHALDAVDRLNAGIERCDQGSVDVVLLDLSLPDSLGIATVATMRAAVPRVPIIVLTGLNDLEVAVHAVREGAQDYLVKGTVTVDILERAMYYAIERKNLEDQLMQYSEHLEELVAQKTAELKRAERLAAIGQMAAMVGHDLRSPLQAILNTIHLEKKQVDKLEGHFAPSEAPEAQQLRDGLDKIKEQVAYMSSMVTDLLDFARTPSPKITRTSTEQLVNEALRRVVAPNNVVIEKKLDPSLPDLDVDPFLMRRALINIMSNALQAMPDGGTVCVMTKNNGQSASINVADTGMGIPRENIRKLFEPLFTTKSRGVGLGLAIVKSVIEAHGGTITVESDVGRGSKFCIALPLRS